MTRAARLLAPSLLGLLALAACGGPAPLSDGRWVGTATPQGAAAHGPKNEDLCAGPTRALLSFRGRRFEFEPNEGTLVLPGFVDKSGHLTASLTRPGAAHQAWTASFTGQVTGRHIAGLLALPECRADISLEQVSGPSFIGDLLRD